MQYKTTQFVRQSTMVLFLAFTLTLGACMKNIQHPPLDVTFLPEKGDFLSKDGIPLSDEEIVAMAKDKDYILIGEGHNNLVDHAIQQHIVSLLAASETPFSIGLEMVAVDMQPVLDDFSHGQIDVDSLEDALDWGKRWGYPYSLFKGFFTIAQRDNFPVAGLNTPTRITKKISREGLDSLTEKERVFLPREIVPPAEAQIAMLDMVMNQHRGKSADNSQQRKNFHLIQSIWDSKMAEEAVRLRKQFDRPVLVVAGSGHIEKRWGIARRIARFDPGARMLTVVPWRGGKFNVEDGDIFFYSPNIHKSRLGATLVATGTDGLLVEAVERGSRADKAGLRPGDLILEASGVKLEHLFSLHMAGSKVHETGEELVFLVRRGQETYKANIGVLGQSQSNPVLPMMKKRKSN